jgi:hypothetical protein
MVIFSNETAARATTIAGESMVPAELKIDRKNFFTIFTVFS